MKIMTDLDRAMYGIAPVPGAPATCTLVFDESIHLESVLEAVALEVQQNASPGSSFVCYIVTKADLRTLVNESFNKMAELAVHS